MTPDGGTGLAYGALGAPDTAGPYAADMDVHDFEAIRRYVDFDAAAERALQRVLGLAEPRFPAIIDDFYDAILRTPRAAAVLTEGAAQVQRLKGTLVAWLRSVLLGPFDADWLARHSRIGRVHVQIGLPQELMFTAMNRIRLQLIAVVQEEPDDVERRRMARAVHQVLDLELAVMLDTYRQDLIARMRAAERREVAEAVPAFVVVLDEQGRVLLFNEALEAATGRRRAEMLGTDGRVLVGDGGDRRLPVASGGHRLVRWSCTRTDEGLTYAVGVDVTDEREMQRRTMRAERLAAVGTLAAGLAHEVRNPLNSALLQLQVLRRRVEKGADASDLLEVTSLVSQEIHRLGGLVSDFLAFAQPRPLEVEEVDLGGLLENLYRLVAPEANEASVEMSLDLAPGPCLVDGERERLTQVLLNLTRNALQAMPEGGRLVLRTRAPDAAGNVVVEVEDSGAGFPDDAPIFDAFYTTKPTGTGLGLAIVHRIVQDHGGTVQARSQPGCTVFTLTFPARPAPGPARAQPPRA